MDSKAALSEYPDEDADDDAAEGHGLALGRDGDG